MGKVLKAKVDLAHQTLRLLEPIEGFADDEEVSVIVDREIDTERPWLALKGSLSKEAGGALCVQHNLPLLTNDGGFDHIDGLTVVHW